MPQNREGFVIVANTGKPRAMKMKEEMSKWLIAQGQKVIDEKDPMRMLARFVIAVGGDGTSVHTGAQYSVYGATMIPINIDGGVGFITIGNENNWKVILNKIIGGKHKVEKRIGLSLSFKGEAFGPFVNDVVLKSFPSMTKFKMQVNGHVVYKSVMADGFIIATPTGSTAYNMSARSTVALPGIECLFVTPLNPDQFNVAPMVMTPESAITMEIISVKPASDVYLIVDGETMGKVGTGESIIVKKHEIKLLFAVTDSNHFFRALHNKKGLAR